MIDANEIRDANTLALCARLVARTGGFSLTQITRKFFEYAWRCATFSNFAKLPESETSKPFLEHLEDLRWTIVKMAITLLIAMVICFAFPLGARSHHAAAACTRLIRRSAPCGPWASPIRLRFPFVSPSMRASSVVSAPALFPRGIRSAGADGDGKTVCSARDLRQLRSLSYRCARLLLLASAEDHSLLFSRHGIARLDGRLDGAGILFLRDAVHDRLRARLRVAGGGARAGAFRACHLSVYGADPALCHRPDFHSGHDHYSYARHFHADRDESADVPAL